MTCRPVAALLALALVAPHSARADIAGVPSSCHALVNAKIVAAPGVAPTVGVLVIRDGRIESVGPRVRVPADAIVHDLAGRTIYAGLVEPYLRLPSGPATAADSGARSATVDESASVRSETRAADLLPIDAALLEEMRAAGYSVAQIAPSRGVFRGTTSVVSLGLPRDERATFGVVHHADFAQAMAFEHGDWNSNTYPGSLMGAIALARQTILNAGALRAERRAWERDPARVDRPEENRSLTALLPAIDRLQPMTIECEDVPMIERALKFSREFGLRPIVISGGSDEWRWMPDVRASFTGAAGVPLVVAVDFPEVPLWEDAEDRLSIELDDLKQWERAPANLAALEKAGVSFSVTTQGLGKRADVFARLRDAIERGLSPAVALASLTTNPARLLGVESRAGTIAPGKDANLLVVTREIFELGAEIEETWVDGVRFGPDAKRANETDLKAKWDLEVGPRGQRVRVELDPTKEAFAGAVVARPGETLAADSASVAARKLTNVTVARGTFAFSVADAAWEGSDARFELRRDGKILRGVAIAGADTLDVVGKKAPAEPLFTPALEDLSANAPVWPPVALAKDAPRSVLVKGATVWTCGPNGVLENADLLVQDGRIARVGRDLSAPRGASVLEADGRHVTPGIIDCHSHSDISGGVNEGTNSCTAEVRIGDVIDPSSPAIMRELAGGLTISNLLHGSANSIGGQNAVIKLRWGANAHDLLFAAAPQGIKFALGENVKQSNWGDNYVTRYPQTRMGVEQFIRERFLAAKAYRDERRVGGKGAPVRRDLQLEALVEILEGRRLVHCHSYRADEILMLIRLAEEMGFRVATFQHVLEGYKVADEMAAHGAGASAFSDWWSYKYEVVDAIPYLGDILYRRGVVTSYNSDSDDFARRLNLEAAKAVKYGRVPPEEALKFVTLNPAKQLGIDRRVGSLEPGKDADFVLWSGPPLSDLSVCLETWVDGVRRFSRAEDLAARQRAEELREKLLAKAEKVRRAKLKAGELKTPAATEPKKPTFGALWGVHSSEGCGAMEVGDCIEHEEAACSGSR